VVLSPSPPNRLLILKCGKMGMCLPERGGCNYTKNPLNSREGSRNGGGDVGTRELSHTWLEGVDGRGDVVTPRTLPRRGN